MRQNVYRSAVFTLILPGPGRPPSTTLGIRKLETLDSGHWWMFVRVAEWLPFHVVWYKNICSASFSFVTILESTRVTDGQTDGRTDRQNYDSQDRPRICSRSKNDITDNAKKRNFLDFAGISRFNRYELSIKIGHHQVAPEVVWRVLRQHDCHRFEVWIHSFTTRKDNGLCHT